MNANVPASVERHLGAIQFADDGKLFVTASNLTGRNWNGGIYCFTNPDDAPDILKCFAGTDTESGISEACCLKQNTIVVGLDSGAVKVLQLEEKEQPHFDTLSYSLEHDDIVSSLSVNSNGSKLVSAGYDKCIKVWDLETFESIATYKPIHTGIVWQVSCSTMNPDMLVSCGQDGKALLLDLRLPKPATPMYSCAAGSSPTAVAWQPNNEFVFSIGNDDGFVAIKDMRNFDKIAFFKPQKRPVFKLAFSPISTNLLASCADDTRVVISDISKDNPNTEYSNEDHLDFVRGMTWNSENQLFTSGWDKQVLKHSVNSVDMDLSTRNNVTSI